MPMNFRSVMYDKTTERPSTILVVIAILPDKTDRSRQSSPRARPYLGTTIKSFGWYFIRMRELLTSTMACMFASSARLIIHNSVSSLSSTSDNV